MSFSVLTLFCDNARVGETLHSATCEFNKSIRGSLSSVLFVVSLQS